MAERPALQFLLQLFALSLVARSTTSAVDELLLLQTSASDKQSPPGISGRILLQDSAVCGFNEYFCGEAAFISDKAYNAVSGGECFNDTGVLPRTNYDQAQPAT